MNELMNHYNVWKCFQNKVYNKTLTSEYLCNKGNEQYIETVTQVEKTESGHYIAKEGRLVQLKCLVLEKSGYRYILPSKHKKDMPLTPRSGFDCFLKKSDKTIHHFIEQPAIAKITPVKTLSLKDLLNVFNPIQHSNPQTMIFLKLQAIASKAKGCKYRLCSPPNCAKNSTDTILNCITCDNVKVSRPTLAKLETLFYFKQKVLPDELSSLTSSQVREVEPFFLSIADESPTFQKHSMAQKYDMNEVDVSRSSCIFTYNDPGSIKESLKHVFFDDIWQNIAAFNSRYPALYLTGFVQSTIPKLSLKQADKILEDNWDYYRTIAKNIVYYIENMHIELHDWDRSKCILKGRHRTNFEGVLDGLDVISDSQTEFDSWLDYVNDRVKAYQDLIKSQDKQFKIEFESI